MERTARTAVTIAVAIFAIIGVWHIGLVVQWLAQLPLQILAWFAGALDTAPPSLTIALAGGFVGGIIAARVRAHRARQH